MNPIDTYPITIRIWAFAAKARTRTHPLLTDTGDDEAELGNTTFIRAPPTRRYVHCVVGVGQAAVEQRSCIMRMEMR